MQPMMPNLTAELTTLAERLSQSTVRVECRGGAGSGVIWKPDGLVVTNAHVMQRRRATVRLTDGRELPANLLAHDGDRDLAALRLDASDLPAATIGDSEQLRVGQLVFALGNPHGREKALSAGVIHAIAASDNERRSWLQADLTLHPGNSGGPLFDTSGAVIGVNSMIANGLALAIPSSAVLDFLAPSQPKPILGVNCEPVTLSRRIAETSGVVSAEGLLIVAVATGSAAQRAGLILGDVITGVGANSAALHSSGALSRQLSAVRAGAALTLEILRAGKREYRRVSLDEPLAHSTHAA